jgi:hypothetical protein
MRRMLAHRWWSGAAALLLGLGAPLAAGTPASAIQNGGVIGSQEQQDRGLVSITGGCSGVLLTNDWLLTAGHCLAGDRTAVENITAAITTGSATSSASADALYLFAGFADEVGPDLALVHLRQPLTVHGTTTGFTTTFWPGSMADLKTGTRTVSIYGRGSNTYTQCADPATNQPLIATGGGTYRSGTARIGAVGLEPDATPGNINKGSTQFTEKSPGRYLQLVDSGAGQLPLEGDSGGPSFIFNPPSTQPYLVGIQSSANCEPGAQPNTASATRVHQVAIPAVRDWINAVLATRWTPGATGANVWVGPAEADGVRWPVGDVNTAGWAQAARASAAMCYARGYAGGHYDGHQGTLENVAGSGLLCAAGGAQWRDLTAAEINATGWGFTDVNTVNWAQANRAAERFCATAVGGGYVGGHFTGHQRDGKYGVLCYRDGAQWFDAQPAELAAAGWPLPTPTLDDVPWAQAARAATGFCRGKGFAGGFLNGQFLLGQRYGVVCQK